MNNYIPILTAFIGATCGALLGAYFSFISRKRERVWIERYETLKKISESIGVIRDVYEIDHLKSLGVEVVSADEWNQMVISMNTSKIKLRELASNMKLLFKQTELVKFEELQIALNIALKDVFNGEPQDYKPDMIQAIAEAADALQQETIAIAEKKCL